VDLLRTTPKKVVIENMQWLAGDEELNDYDEYVACPPPLKCVLNVARSRESHASDMQDAVFRLMVDVLIKANLTSKHCHRLRKARRVKCESKI
jgi:hypothetical protein